MDENRKSSERKPSKSPTLEYGREGSNRPGKLQRLFVEVVANVIGMAILPLVAAAIVYLLWIKGCVH